MWFKSSFSQGQANCVEANVQPEQVGVRDTKKREGGTLWFSAEAWNAFLREIKTPAGKGGPV